MHAIFVTIPVAYIECLVVPVSDAIVEPGAMTFGQKRKTYNKRLVAVYFATSEIKK